MMTFAFLVILGWRERHIRRSLVLVSVRIHNTVNGIVHAYLNAYDHAYESLRVMAALGRVGMRMTPRPMPMSVFLPVIKLRIDGRDKQDGTVRLVSQDAERSSWGENDKTARHFSRMVVYMWEFSAVLLFSDHGITLGFSASSSHRCIVQAGYNVHG